MKYFSSAATNRIAPRREPITPNVSSYLSNLRLRAIMALSASLAQEQRQNLLSYMGAIDKETAERQKRSSVGEAVAYALAQEATKRGAQYEQDEEKIMKRAQQAVEQRIMNDLVIQERQQALERWKRELKEEEEKELETKVVQPKSEHELQPIQTTVVPVQQRNMEPHPILGPVIYDLGYKRVHITSAKALSAIPIWSQQRSYRHDRAKIMALDKMKSLDLGLPGIISLHEVLLYQKKHDVFHLFHTSSSYIILP